MRFQRVIEQVNYRPWFITAEGYASVKQVLDLALSTGIYDRYQDKPSDAGPFSFFVNDRPELSIDKNGIATIHVMGVLGQKLSNLEKSCGNTGYEQVIGEINQALKEGAEAFLFVHDSPGGGAVGAGETARIIGEIQQPTASFTDSLMASASYYMAAGTDFIVAESSAIVGSIGTILPWVDQSKLWSVRGLTFDPIKNEGADLKDSLHGPSLSEEHRAFLQEHVNDLGAQFQEFVASYREVDEEVWRAGFYIGSRAASMNLVDDVGSIEVAKDYLISQIRG